MIESYRLHAADRHEYIRNRRKHVQIEPDWARQSVFTKSHAQAREGSNTLLLQVNNITDAAIYALAERRSGRNSKLTRVHLSYCENLTMKSVAFLLMRLPYISHLSLTGVRNMRTPEYQRFCKPAPKVNSCKLSSHSVLTNNADRTLFCNRNSMNTKERLSASFRERMSENSENISFPRSRSLLIRPLSILTKLFVEVMVEIEIVIEIQRFNRPLQSERVLSLLLHGIPQVTPEWEKCREMETTLQEGDLQLNCETVIELSGLGFSDLKDSPMVTSSLVYRFRANILLIPWEAVPATATVSALPSPQTEATVPILIRISTLTISYYMLLMNHSRSLPFTPACKEGLLSSFQTAR